VKVLYGIFVALFMIATPVSADQNDPALDELFERLLSTSDPTEGRLITREIWVRWHEFDDTNINILLRNGVALMTAGNFNSALALFNRIVRRAPDFAEGWNKRATVLYMLDRNDESLSDIRQTLELEPRHFGALSGLGLIYMDSGNYGAALIAFRSARDLNPHMPGVSENIERAESLLRSNTI
jgi:tetratricopeptide (TPR) repeat protein